MRMSCNGCRVLRKGCSENCTIRPCLQWIKTSDSQANATVFLAKFYGRAGLMNLIKAGPEHLRPAIFRSLLYEACGRIVNPIYGSVGLLWSGSWQFCQNAVEAVLRGDPITQIPTDLASENKNGPPLNAYDIRHVNKEENLSGSNDLHRVRTRCRFKRSSVRAKTKRVWAAGSGEESGHEEVNRSPSHESSLSHQSGAAEPVLERESRERQESQESGSLVSGETAEADLFGRAQPTPEPASNDDEVAEMELELTLGTAPVKNNVKPKETQQRKAADRVCRMELELDLPAL
ncbi:LOB domain-containing protein 41-like [Olea europaea var. sylvestris]|uniref:LOB domain-containing protein 41-like n=1 Tax=Olea europaea var. sylvestris TaxID=158386 RepID=UPI000C1D54D0|nr:LOB domain-containing protein 41-like [Olea europaea var. sylvestris]